MVIEFVVNAGCLKSDGTVETLSFSLGNYTGDEGSTAYQKLADAVNGILVAHPYFVEVIWIMVGFVSIREDSGYVPLLTMQGSSEWFKTLYYFKKVIGDAGSSTATPVSCGFVDMSRNLRVELENGIVQMRAAD